MAGPSNNGVMTCEVHTQMESQLQQQQEHWEALQGEAEAALAAAKAAHAADKETAEEAAAHAAQAAAGVGATDLVPRCFGGDVVLDAQDDKLKLGNLTCMMGHSSCSTLKKVAGE